MANAPSITSQDQSIFLGWAAVLLSCTLLSFLAEQWLIMTIPVVLLGAYAVMLDLRILYIAFFALLPLSVEVEVGSFGTDLPSEPIMLILTGVGLVLMASRLGKVRLPIIYHPITVVLIAHIGWILVTAVFSQTPVISAKFFLAKLWYVIPFYFMTFFYLKSEAEVLSLFKIISISLTLVCSFVLYKHYGEDFSFDSSNKVCYPIFRNHVNYASMIVAVVPYAIAVFAIWRKKWQFFCMSLLVVATYFSYTRAAFVALILMIGVYIVIRLRLMKLAIAGGLIAITFLAYNMVQDTKYMDFAPDFSKTISHDKFGNLVEATYKMEDISTMERVYRWVAGGHMIAERPWLGYGPGGFYPNYKNYTVESFRTYVSDNPERSGVHSYYLMTWIEQGLLGLVLFLGLIISILLVGESTYHKLTDKKERWIVLAAIFSFVNICLVLIINDMVETDKVGPFFFLNASLITYYSLKYSIGHKPNNVSSS